jgi:GDSL-like Lipase/Acylhydrolase family
MQHGRTNALLSGTAMPRRVAIGTSLLAIGASAQAGTRSGHIVLLGDSIFDNAGYLAGKGPDVAGQLRVRLPAGWKVILLARGGAVAADVPAQLGGLPRDATHLIVSAGGNDAGRQAGVLTEQVQSVAGGLARIAALREQFARDYHAMLDAVLARRLALTVCTVYDPRFPDPEYNRVAVVALAAFNDVISRAAFRRGLPIIDLRLVCDRAEDFASPTGPSVQGGGKIAAAIAQLATEHNSRDRSVIYAGRTG